MAGGATPGVVVGCSKRKQARETMRSKLVSSPSPQPKHQPWLPGLCQV